MVVDVRHRVEFESEPTIIPGALHLMIEELEARPQEARATGTSCSTAPDPMRPPAPGGADPEAPWHRTGPSAGRRLPRLARSRLPDDQRGKHTGCGPAGSIGHGQADPVSCRR
jgi:hypothetical protein